MPDIVSLTILFVLPALIFQFLGKFFVALFLQPIPDEKRLQSATVSTAGCAFAAPFVYLLFAHFQTAHNDLSWFNTSLFFFVPSALIDILILAPFRKRGLKIPILYLVVDYIVANLSPIAITLMNCD
jgi:hypothetical protein